MKSGSNFFGFGRFTIYSDILFVDAQENISTQVYHIGGWRWYKKRERHKVSKWHSFNASFNDLILGGSAHFFKNHDACK